MPRQRKKLLIVDGYNVLRSGSRYQRIDDPDYTDDWFNAARDALVNDVINFAGREWRAIVVFDGGGNANSAGEARERQVETLVVSSDATIQDTVFGFGIDRMSAEGFSRELGAYYEEARLDDAPRVSKKNTVAERIPADTLAKLMRMRDGR